MPRRGGGDMFRLYQSAKNGKPEISKPEETQPPEPIEGEITTTEPEGFSMEKHNLEMKALRITRELRGAGFLRTRAGKNLARSVFEALERNDPEALEAIRSRYTPHNPMPDARTRFLGLMNIKPSTY